MIPREEDLFGCTRPKASQGSVPAGLILASGFGFCFQCKEGSGLVLRRPIETTAFTGEVKSGRNHWYSNAASQDLAL
jgi:hypothetical protein